MTPELPFIRHLAARGDPGTQPRRLRGDGRTVVTYSSTRLLFRADAFEGLPPDGIVLIYIRPKGQPPFAVAMTRAEAEREFANVFETSSWRDHGNYHYATFPQRASRYIVAKGPRSAGR
jgi:hypothetical protein